MTPAVAAPVTGGTAPLDAAARALFPRAVAVATAPVLAGLHGLAPAEAARVAKAVPKRQNEFATGRRLAHGLLARFGVRDFALLADDARMPLWPSGLVGSISHSSGACVVALAEERAYTTLGVDVERADAVRPELWRSVLDADEAAWLRAQSGDVLALAAVFFSAKEAVYKAQFPKTRTRLGFHDVQLELELATGAFRARVPGFAAPLAGAFALAHPWVLTGVALAAGTGTA